MKPLSFATFHFSKNLTSSCLLKNELKKNLWFWNKSLDIQSFFNFSQNRSWIFEPIYIFTWNCCSGDSSTSGRNFETGSWYFLYETDMFKYQLIPSLILIFATQNNLQDMLLLRGCSTSGRYPKTGSWSFYHKTNMFTSTYALFWKLLWKNRISKWLWMWKNVNSLHDNPMSIHSLT